MVNVAGDATFVGRAGGFLGGRRNSFFAENLLGFGGIAFGFDERVLAIHHAGAGLLAQDLDNFGTDFHDLIS